MSSIPTFRSDRVTAKPSMGIVDQSGTRAFGEAVAQQSQFFDVVGDFANQKADQFMERSQRLAAEEAVRSGGLNPNDLSSPITAADRIYREAALNTYAIGVEDKIDKTLNRLYSESQYDPAGFQKKATEYMRGASSELAPELKNSVSKYALADMRRKAFSLDQELKAKTLNEAQELEKIKLEEIATKINNADDPEEKQSQLLKAMGLINSSVSALSPELKAQKAEEFSRDMAEAGIYKGLAMSQVRPDVAIQQLEDLGINVTVTKMQQVYNSYGVKEAFHRRERQQGEAVQSQQMIGFLDNVYNQTELARQNGIVDDGQMAEIRDNTKKALVSMGAPAERLFEFETNFNKYMFGQQRDAPEVVNQVRDMINNVSAETPALIKKAHLSGAISTQTKIQLEQEAKEALSSPLNSTTYDIFEIQTLKPLYPKAFKTPDEVDLIVASGSADEIRAITEQKASVASIKRGIESRVAADDGIGLQQALAEEVNRLAQQGLSPNETRFEQLEGDDTTKHRILNMLNAENPTVRIFAPTLGTSKRLLDLNSQSPDMSLLPLEAQKKVAIFDGTPWNNNNAPQRLNVMIGTTRQYLNAELSIQDESPPPFGKDELLAIARRYNLTGHESLIRDMYDE